MARGIYVCGASDGAAALGAELARALGFRHFELRVYDAGRDAGNERLLADLRDCPNFVLSGCVGFPNECPGLLVDLCVLAGDAADGQAGRQRDNWADALHCPVARADAAKGPRDNALSIAERFYQKPGMPLRVQIGNLLELQKYRFVVIFAKYEGQWLYSQHKQRDTWETAGGHIERGETPLDAAKRELYEETGAADFEIVPAFDYAVHREREFSYGQVFFAQVSRLADLPESEMRGVKLFPGMPDSMTYPQILPVIYERMQGWLNTQSSAGELWDVYDRDRSLTGRVHRRGDPLPEGDFHLIVSIWIMNGGGEFLITKRTPNKGYANMWESTGGSAIAGDDSLAAALREVREETGLTLSPSGGKCVLTLQGANYFHDIWLFRQDFDLREVVLQPGETCDAKWASQDEIHAMTAAGAFIPFSYVEWLFEQINADIAESTP